MLQLLEAASGGCRRGSCLAGLLSALHLADVEGVLALRLCNLPVQTLIAHSALVCAALAEVDPLEAGKKAQAPQILAVRLAHAFAVAHRLSLSRSTVRRACRLSRNSIQPSVNAPSCACFRHWVRGRCDRRVRICPAGASFQPASLWRHPSNVHDSSCCFVRVCACLIAHFTGCHWRGMKFL